MTDASNCFICLEGISKSYNEGGVSRQVLRDAHASLLYGEFVAILGKSGSGKSTLLNLISGIDLVDKGSIWINGQQLTSMSELNRTLFRRENIGFIFQFFNLIPTLTCLENVCLPLELNAISPTKAKSRAIELLTAVGLSDRLSTFPEDLSGGEQQRVAIARAIVHDPLLVLADEPTGNLDEDTGSQIMALLDRLTRKAGKNLIMVTHNLDAASMADRTLYLREGKLLTNESSTMPEFVQQG